MGIWPFDQATDAHQQYAQAYQNGTYGDLPPQQVAQDYQHFVQNAPPEVVQSVHQQYFQQMPQVERTGLFSSLLGALNQNGANPQQQGYNNINPQQATPSQLGGLFNMAQSSGLLGNLLGGGQQQQGYGQQQQGGGLQSILSNPLAQMAISGIMSYGINRAMNGGLQGLMGGGQQQQGNIQQQPQQSQQPFDTGGGGNF